MALPKLDLPRHYHKLTGIDKKVAYRPFTVREQKILLHAKALEDNLGEESTPEQQREVTQAHAAAMMQIIELCTFGDVDPNQLPIFDVEDLFLRIRARSVSEISTVGYLAKYVDVDGVEQKKRVQVNINLDNVKVVTDPDHTRNIMLTDTVGITMKYPTITMAMQAESDEATEDDELAQIRACIDSVFDHESVYPFGKESVADQNAFIDDLDTASMMKIKEFFDTMPRLRHQEEIDVDGRKQTVYFEGLSDFFG